MLRRLEFYRPERVATAMSTAVRQNVGAAPRNGYPITWLLRGRNQPPSSRELRSPGSTGQAVATCLYKATPSPYRAQCRPLPFVSLRTLPPRRQEIQTQCHPTIAATHTFWPYASIQTAPRHSTGTSSSPLTINARRCGAPKASSLPIPGPKPCLGLFPFASTKAYTRPQAGKTSPCRQVIGTRGKKMMAPRSHHKNQSSPLSFSCLRRLRFAAFERPSSLSRRVIVVRLPRPPSWRRTFV